MRVGLPPPRVKALPEFLLNQLNAPPRTPFLNFWAVRRRRLAGCAVEPSGEFDDQAFESADGSRGGRCRSRRSPPIVSHPASRTPRAAPFLEGRRKASGSEPPRTCRCR